MAEELDKRTQPTGDDFKSLFDYGEITERDKSVVQEVINLINERPGVPGSMIAEELKTKFQLVSIPMMKLEDSIWHQLTKDERIGQSMQGYRESNDKDGNKIRIPHIGFSADLDFLDEFVNRLANKIMAVTKKTEDK
tara:strand:- start:1013 stop:1423 length:411 start_codon:yes stop_codon:yes gene_type:complete